MNLKYLLFAVGMVLWFSFCSWWWHCPAWENCPDDSEQAQKAPIVENTTPEPNQNTPGPIGFEWGKDQPIVDSTLFAHLKDSLLQALGTDKILHITGLFNRNEDSLYSGTAGSLGINRANAISRLFGTYLDPNRMTMEGRMDPIGRDALQGAFEAANFEIRAHIPEIVELGQENFRINFGYNSNQYIPSETVVKRIQSAVDYLKSSGKQVQLVGHTDSTATAEYNLYLSRSRAEAIRNILIEQGVTQAQIKVVAKGETEILNKKDPAGPENRRVDVLFQ